MSPVRLPVGFSLVLVSLLAAGLGAQDAAQRQPTFRSRVTVVPIDVRVLDDRGRPVTELQPDEHVRYLRDGISFAVRTPVRAEPRRVKIVLYDVEMDVIGSATADVPGR